MFAMHLKPYNLQVKLGWGISFVLTNIWFQLVRPTTLLLIHSGFESRLEGDVLVFQIKYWNCTSKHINLREIYLSVESSNSNILMKTSLNLMKLSWYISMPQCLQSGDVSIFVIIFASVELFRTMKGNEVY